MNRDEKRREKEIAIYRAALKLIEEGADVSQLKVQQIATAAGIGKGTVYEYFSSKDEILRGMSEYCISSEIGHFRACIDPCDSLEMAVDAFLDWLIEGARNRASNYHMVAEALRDYNFTADVQDGIDLVARLLEPLRKVFDRVKEKGELPPDADPYYCAYVAGSSVLSCMALLSNCSSGLRMDAEQVRAYARRMLLAALR